MSAVKIIDLVKLDFLIEYGIVSVIAIFFIVLLIIRSKGEDDYSAGIFSFSSFLTLLFFVVFLELFKLFGVK